MQENRVQVMKAPKGAFSKEDIAKIKAEFKCQGIDLIVVSYNNNAVQAPEFQRLDPVIIKTEGVV